jgi:hypothetical protein
MHPDNEMIDEVTKLEESDAQGSRAGGTVNRDVGTRAEKGQAEGNLTGDMVERATGSDNPEQDAKKGPKTRAAIQDERNS